MKVKDLLKPERHKILFSVLVVLAVIAVIIVSVNAKYLYRSEEVKNTFAPAVSVLPEIEETFDGNVKKDVAIEVGETDYPVYVRAKLVFNWQSDGTVYFAEPKENVDYTLTINEEYWELKSDGYYYYKDAVSSEGVTEPLILECKPINSAPDTSYSLSVNVIAQTVQAVGHTDNDRKTAQEDAWNLVETTSESTSE